MTVALYYVSSGDSIQSSFLQTMPLTVLYEVRPLHVLLFVALLSLNFLVFGFNYLNRSGYDLDEWLQKRYPRAGTWTRYQHRLIYFGAAAWILSYSALHSKPSAGELAFLRSKDMDQEYKQKREDLATEHQKENSLPPRQKLIYGELLKRQLDEQNALDREMNTEKTRLEAQIKAVERQQKQRTLSPAKKESN